MTSFDYQMSDNERSVHQLPNGTVKLLTSAQVITSVVSVVKELIENSLDAGSTVIDIKLENYGFDRIEVRDNGSGISTNDTPYMARPHYTSKISGSEDLETLQTYGFRGEALGSLCAVSDVTITTKTSADDLSQTYSVSHEGLITSVKPSHLGNGTTVVASQLFKNLPVRRNYFKAVKKKKEELKKVEDLLTAFGVISYNVSFTLRHGRDLVWQKCAAQNSKEVLLQIFGCSVMGEMVHCQHKDDVTQMDLEAYFPKPSAEYHMTSRTTNDRCFIFVNNRPVSLKDIEKLILEHYCCGVRCDGGRYPLAFLRIALPPGGLDVNLDPNKTRVFLHDQKEIMDILRHMLEEVYGSIDSNTRTGVGKKSKISKTDEQNDCDSSIATHCTEPDFVSSKKNIDAERKTGTNDSTVQVADISETPNSTEEHQSSSLPGLKVIFEESDVQRNETSCKYTDSSKLGSTVPSVKRHDNNSKPSFEEYVLSTHKAEGKDANTFETPEQNLDAQDACFNLLDDEDLLFSDTQQDSGSAPKSCESKQDPWVENGDTRLSINSKDDQFLSNGEYPIAKFDVNDCDSGNLNKKNSDSLSVKFTGNSESSLSSSSSTHVEKDSEKTSKHNQGEMSSSSTEMMVCEFLADNKKDCDAETHEQIRSHPHFSDEVQKNQITENNNDVHVPAEWTKGTALTSRDGKLVEPVRLLIPGSYRAAEEITTPQRCRYSADSFQGTPKINRLKIAANSPGQTTIFDMVHSKPVKRPTAGYLYYCQEAKTQVQIENSEATMADIEELLMEKWKDLTSDQRQNFEHLALKPAKKSTAVGNVKSPNSTAVSPSVTKQAAKKRKLNAGKTVHHPESSKNPESKVSESLPRLIAPFSLRKLKSVSHLGTIESQESANKHQLIGQLKSHGAWVSFHDNQIVLVIPTRIQETLIYLRLMGNHSLSTERLETPITLKPSLVGGDEAWKALMSMQKSQFQLPDPHTYYNDPRLVKNGFNIREVVDPDSSDLHVQICGLTRHMNYFGLVDLRDILEIVTANHAATLSDSRPIKIRHYLQGEAVRMARQLPLGHSREDVSDILSQAQRYLPPGCTTCFHNKPFLLSLYDLAELPSSQEMTEFSQTQTTQEDT